MRGKGAREGWEGGARGLPEDDRDLILGLHVEDIFGHIHLVVTGAVSRDIVATAADEEVDQVHVHGVHATGAAARACSGEWECGVK